MLATAIPRRCARSPTWSRRRARTSSTPSSDQPSSGSIVWPGRRCHRRACMAGGQAVAYLLFKPQARRWTKRKWLPEAACFRHLSRRASIINQPMCSGIGDISPFASANSRAASRKQCTQTKWQSPVGHSRNQPRSG